MSTAASTLALKYPALDTAIASFEGFGQPNSLATKNNNPGNLIAGSFATSHGATSVDANGFAVFPDAATGAGAEDSLVGYYSNQGYSLSGLINAWAPPTAPGNSAVATQNYTDYVSKALGVSSTTPISETSNLSLSNQLGTPSQLSSPLGTGPTQSGALSPTSITGALNSALSTAGSVANLLAGNPLGATGLIPGFSWGRVGTFVAGLIVIAGGIYLFKPVQNIVNSSARGAVKALAA